MKYWHHVEISGKYSTDLSRHKSIFLSRLQHITDITVPNTDFWKKRVVRIKDINKKKVQNKLWIKHCVLNNEI